MAVKITGGSGSISIPFSEWHPGYDVYLLAGQSNMGGRATLRVGVDDVYTAISALVEQFGFNSQTVKAATNPLDYVDEIAGSMGLWLNFCNAIVGSLEAGRTVLLVPVGEGGTSFVDNEWNQGDRVYEAAKSSLAAAMTQGTGSNILKAVLWIQGEADAADGAPAAAAHQAALQAMWDAASGGDWAGMTTSTPFIVGTINPGNANAPTVNTGLSNFATANAAVKFVDLTDLVWFDTFHYDAASSATIGTRFAGEL